MALETVKDALLAVQEITARPLVFKDIKDAWAKESAALGFVTAEAVDPSKFVFTPEADLNPLVEHLAIALNEGHDDALVPAETLVKMREMLEALRIVFAKAEAGSTVVVSAPRLGLDGGTVCFYSKIIKV
jgi:hypothetical protein